MLEKAKTLPNGPGCYLMLNDKGEVIYVGKAKNLKKRVTSYFNQSQKTPKTLMLIKNIRDFDFISTMNEAESFVLENNLIKEHSPKYNIRLKDDRTYPYVAVNELEEFSQLLYVRKPKNIKGQILFGPYPVGSGISKVLEVTRKAFQLRDCSDYKFHNRTKPCLLYQLHQCSAPCVNYISAQDYQAQLQRALQIFKGQKQAKNIILEITQEMFEFSEREEFERAAMMRDYISELELFLQDSYEQHVELQEEIDMDIISFYAGEDELDVSIYLVRRGIVLGVENFFFPLHDMLDELREEILRYLLQYYDQLRGKYPQKIVIDFQGSLLSDFKTALEGVVSQQITVVGNSSKYKNILKLALENARQTQEVRKERKQRPFEALEQVKKLLHLEETPRLLECYDIAIWQGDSPTAAKVVFHDGRPDKKNYRYYHLTKREEGNNDFAMMQETFERRLPAGKLPDVFVIDGGKPQMNAVKKILTKHGLDIPMVGIIKGKNQEDSQEKLLLEGKSETILLTKYPALMYILTFMRDEAHRFSRRLHHHAEKKRLIK